MVIIAKCKYYSDNKIVFLYDIVPIIVPYTIPSGSRHVITGKEHWGGGLLLPNSHLAPRLLPYIHVMLRLLLLILVV